MWDVILNFEKVFCFILVFYQLFFFIFAANYFTVSKK